MDLAAAASRYVAEINIDESDDDRTIEIDYDITEGAEELVHPQKPGHHAGSSLGNPSSSLGAEDEFTEDFFEDIDESGDEIEEAFVAAMGSGVKDRVPSASTDRSSRPTSANLARGPNAPRDQLPPAAQAELAKVQAFLADHHQQQQAPPAPVQVPVPVLTPASAAPVSSPSQPVQNSNHDQSVMSSPNRPPLAPSSHPKTPSSNPASPLSSPKAQNPPPAAAPQSQSQPQSQQQSPPPQRPSLVIPVVPEVVPEPQISMNERKEVTPASPPASSLLSPRASRSSRSSRNSAASAPPPPPPPPPVVASAPSSSSSPPLSPPTITAQEHMRRSFLDKGISVPSGLGGTIAVDILEASPSVSADTLPLSARSQQQLSSRSSFSASQPSKRSESANRSNNNNSRASSSFASIPSASSPLIDAPVPENNYEHVHRKSSSKSNRNVANTVKQFEEFVLHTKAPPQSSSPNMSFSSPISPSVTPIDVSLAVAAAGPVSPYLQSPRPSGSTRPRSASSSRTSSSSSSVQSSRRRPSSASSTSQSRAFLSPPLGLLESVHQHQHQHPINSARSSFSSVARSSSAASRPLSARSNSLTFARHFSQNEEYYGDQVQPDCSRPHRHADSSHVVDQLPVDEGVQPRPPSSSRAARQSFNSYSLRVKGQFSSSSSSSEQVLSHEEHMLLAEEERDRDQERDEMERNIYVDIDGDEEDENALSFTRVSIPQQQATARSHVSSASSRATKSVSAASPPQSARNNNVYTQPQKFVVVENSTRPQSARTRTWSVEAAEKNAVVIPSSSSASQKRNAVAPASSSSSSSKHRPRSASSARTITSSSSSSAAAASAYNAPLSHRAQQPSAPQSARGTPRGNGNKIPKKSSSSAHHRDQDDEEMQNPFDRMKELERIIQQLSSASTPSSAIISSSLGSPSVPSSSSSTSSSFPSAVSMPPEELLSAKIEFLALCRLTKPSFDVHIIRAQLSLAQTYLEANMLEVAFANATAARQEQLQSSSPAAIRLGYPCLIIMAMCKFKTNVFDRACALFEEALKENEAVWGQDHLSSFQIHLMLGKCYAAFGKYQAALDALARSWEVKEQESSEHEDLTTVYLETGRVYRLMGSVSEAAEYYERGHSILSKQVSKLHTRIFQLRDAAMGGSPSSPRPASPSLLSEGASPSTPRKKIRKENEEEAAQLSIRMRAIQSDAARVSLILAELLTQCARYDDALRHSRRAMSNIASEYMPSSFASPSKSSRDSSAASPASPTPLLSRLSSASDVRSSSPVGRSAAPSAAGSRSRSSSVAEASSRPGSRPTSATRSRPSSAKKQSQEETKSKERGASAGPERPIERTQGLPLIFRSCTLFAYCAAKCEQFDEGFQSLHNLLYSSKCSSVRKSVPQLDRAHAWKLLGTIALAATHYRESLNAYDSCRSILEAVFGPSHEKAKSIRARIAQVQELVDE